MTAPDRADATADTADAPAAAVHDTVARVGEQATLDRILPLLPPATGALLGPGDDAAVVAALDGRFVVTTDLLVHGPDFRWAWSSPHDVGWKAAASNLADVAAMGARPTALTVALAAPPDTPVAVLEQIATGLRDACAALSPGCGVVGGDLSTSDVFTVAVTAFGDLEGRAPVTRAGARPGDVVALAGDAGLAAAGLARLFADAVDDAGEPFAGPVARLRAGSPAVEAQLAPRPPISSGVAAALAGATAMLDVSDGLALDARRLARASGAALDLHAASLGPDVATALAGGEDHALLATFPPDAVLPDGFRPMGRVVAGAGVLLDGRPIADRGGWDPYDDWDGLRG